MAARINAKPFTRCGPPYAHSGVQARANDYVFTK